MEIIHFFDTHVYPGCVAILSFKHLENTKLMSVKAEFNDGAYANAQIEFVNLEELILHISGYKTKQCATIPRKKWLLKYDMDEEFWKVSIKI